MSQGFRFAPVCDEAALVAFQVAARRHQRTSDADKGAFLIEADLRISRGNWERERLKSRSMRGKQEKAVNIMS